MTRVLSLDVFNCIFNITDRSNEFIFFSLGCNDDITRTNRMEILIATDSEIKASNKNKEEIKKGNHLIIIRMSVIMISEEKKLSDY